MEIVLVNNFPDYGESYWVENIRYMLNNVKAKYNDIHVIDDILYGGVYDKLRLFDIFRDNRQYLYFDLDVIINGNIDHLWRTDFTLLTAWWRPEFHTPLNSSIMSWSGNHSHIHDKFAEDPDYYIVKYYKGIDEFIYKEIEYKTYDKVCDAYAWGGGSMPITLYNHARDEVWKHKCSLSGPAINTDQSSKNTLIQKYQM